MLLELRVSNFGIIDRIDWRPGPGLNVITGETGAGKSLVIDAVEMLLSGKADESAVRHGADAAYLEAVFDIAGNNASRLRELTDENGFLEPDENTLIISGEIRHQGRSNFRINGKTASRGTLREIGKLLVDIHGQSQHLSLLDRSFHLHFLDSCARATDLRSEFSSRAARLQQIEQEMRDMREREKELARQEEFLRFQVEELRRAGLSEGEEEGLEKDLAIQASSEKLISASHEAYIAIYGDESQAVAVPALEKLEEAKQALQSVVEIDDTLKPQLDRLYELVSILTDIAGDLRTYRDRVEYDPEKLQELELRLDLIRGLKRKYGQTIGEILEYQKEAESKLAGISTSGERLKDLEGQRQALRKEMGEIAAQLSEKRSMAASELVTSVENELKELNMQQVRFEVLITKREDGEGLILPDGASYAFTREGVDSGEFMASTNPGEPLKPLAAIASTGEISRFMLAMKSALARADNIPLLIFDEIDIGVGGRSGEIIGRKLAAIAASHQTVCITHLPQIAVFADSHYSVRKTSSDKRTSSSIELIEGDERIKELALMLSGPGHGKIAIDNAGDLLRKAEAWKQERPSSQKRLL